MTQTLAPNDSGEISAGLTWPPVLRRPDATGEYPTYRRLADVPTEILQRGSEDLARVQLGETMVLPVDAVQAPPRHAAPTVYLPGPEPLALAEVLPQPKVRPKRYRGRYRKAPWPRWAFGTLMFGSGWASCAVTILAGLFALAVTR